MGRSVAITEESDLRSKPLRYRDICTKYHEEWLGHSGNNEVISSASWEDALLVSPIGVIYTVQRNSDGNGIHTKLHENWIGHSDIIKVISSALWKDSELVVEEFKMYAVEMTLDGKTHTTVSW